MANFREQEIREELSRWEADYKNAQYEGNASFGFSACEDRMKELRTELKGIQESKQELWDDIKDMLGFYPLKIDIEEIKNRHNLK